MHGETKKDYWSRMHAISLHLANSSHEIYCSKIIRDKTGKFKNMDKERAQLAQFGESLKGYLAFLEAPSITCDIPEAFEGAAGKALEDLVINSFPPQAEQDKREPLKYSLKKLSEALKLCIVNPAEFDRDYSEKIAKLFTRFNNHAYDKLYG